MYFTLYQKFKSDFYSFRLARFLQINTPPYTIMYAIVSFINISLYALWCSSTKKPETNTYKKARTIKIKYGMKQFNIELLKLIVIAIPTIMEPIKVNIALSKI